MKIVSILFFVAIFCLHAEDVVSQRVTLQGNNLTVKDCLDAIERQTDYLFIYDNDVDVTRQVSMDIESQPIDNVLKNMATQLGLNYVKKGTYVILSYHKMAEAEISSAISQQAKKIKGVVKDSEGEPIVGANVILKGTNTGSITDVDGNFQLDVTQGATLQISYIGYLTQEVKVENQQVLSITLEEDLQSLEEVVVVGYGTMKKKDLTGAVKRVNLEEKPAILSTNVLGALVGSTAGLNVTANSGGADPDVSVSIRGTNSFSASQAPLLVVDGIIYNHTIKDFNANDIESIDILKDAAAAAVYGARSANGVILITTKKGKSEKPTVTFDMTLAQSSPSNYSTKVMNAEQYVTRAVDYIYQAGLFQWYQTNPTSAEGRPAYPDVSTKEAKALYLLTQDERDNYLNGQDIDWISKSMNNTLSQNYTLSVGANAKWINYYMSVGYQDENGILLNDNYKRYSFKANAESRITDWLKVGGNINFNHRDQSNRTTDVNGSVAVSPLTKYDFDNPGHMILTSNGQFDPLQWTLIKQSEIYHTTLVSLLGRIDVPFVKGLSYDFNYSYTGYHRDKDRFYPKDQVHGYIYNGWAERMPQNESNYLFNHIIGYNRTFGDHSVNATLVYTREHSWGDEALYTAQDFEDASLGFNSMQSGTKQMTETSAWAESNIGYMGRINYGFKNRYLLSATVRRDGYSGFGADNKYVTLPSASLGWVVSEEDFNPFKDTYLKLRFSYG